MADPMTAQRDANRRRASRIADLASGGPKVLITKIAALAVVDAIALYAVIVLFLASQWLVLIVVVLVAAAVNWIYFSRRKLPAKYLTPGIIFLAIFQIFVLLYTGYVALTNYGTGPQRLEGAGGLVAHGLRARARRGLAHLSRDCRRPPR